MTSATRSLVAIPLLVTLASCAADPALTSTGALADGDAGLDAETVVEAAFDAGVAPDVDAASPGTDAGGIFVPALVDFCGDGIDQDADGTADDECNRVFVAHIPYSLATYASSGHLLDATDGACAAAASNAGLSGNFVAYVSTSTTAARSRLGSARGFVRVDGKPIADTVYQFANGYLRYPIQLAANGTTGEENVVTVSTSDGYYDATASCVGMTNFGAAIVASGSSQAGGTSFESDGPMGCNALDFAVYCVQTDHQTPLAAPVVPANAHRVFMSQAIVPSGGGLSAADDVCAIEASAAGLPGAFVAFLPTASATAGSRIGNDGDPVVRPDGVVVASTTQAFLARLWNAPIATNAGSGRFIGAQGFWTAAPNPLTESDGNCVDYTSQSAALDASVSVVNRIWGHVAASSMPCNSLGAHVVCIAP